MLRSNRRSRNGLRLAACLGVLSLGGIYTPLRAADLKGQARQGVAPIVLSKNSVLAEAILKIGDLTLVSELEAASLARSAPSDRSYLERCLWAGPDWLRWSDDGTRLEFESPWGSTSRDRVLAAFCEEGVIFLGGSWRRTEEEHSPTNASTFFWDARQVTPVKNIRLAPYVVGSWPRETRYTLTEVRAIDPVSRRVLFAGTSEDGKQVLLAAPFAIIHSASVRN